MNNIFKKEKAYYFDEVYQNCEYASNTDCNCNNRGLALVIMLLYQNFIFLLKQFKKS